MTTIPTLQDVPMPNDDGFTDQQIDEDRLSYVMTSLFGLFGPDGIQDPNTVTVPGFECHALVRALAEEGVTTFSEIIALGGDAISRLHQAPQRVTKQALDTLTGTLNTVRTLAPAQVLEGQWTCLTRSLIAYFIISLALTTELSKSKLYTLNILEAFK